MPKVALDFGTVIYILVVGFYVLQQIMKIVKGAEAKKKGQPDLPTSSAKNQGQKKPARTLKPEAKEPTFDELMAEIRQAQQQQQKAKVGQQPKAEPVLPNVKPAASTSKKSPFSTQSSTQQEAKEYQTLEQSIKSIDAQVVEQKDKEEKSVLKGVFKLNEAPTTQSGKFAPFDKPNAKNNQARQIKEEIRNPTSLKKLVLASEILKRPNW